MTRHVDVMDLVAQMKAAEEAFVLATVVRTLEQQFDQVADPAQIAFRPLLRGAAATERQPAASAGRR